MLLHMPFHVSVPFHSLAAFSTHKFLFGIVFGIRCCAPGRFLSGSPLRTRLWWERGNRGGGARRLRESLKRVPYPSWNIWRRHIIGVRGFGMITITVGRSSVGLELEHWVHNGIKMYDWICRAWLVDWVLLLIDKFNTIPVSIGCMGYAQRARGWFLTIFLLYKCDDWWTQRGRGTRPLR